MPAATMMTPMIAKMRFIAAAPSAAAVRRYSAGYPAAGSCCLERRLAAGLGLVAQPLAVGQRALHVAEGVDDLLGRIDLGELHLRDDDTGTVEVEDGLQQLLRLGLDLAAALGQRLRDLGLADDLAHRA